MFHPPGPEGRLLVEPKRHPPASDHHRWLHHPQTGCATLSERM